MSYVQYFSVPANSGTILGPFKFGVYTALYFRVEFINYY